MKRYIDSAGFYVTDEPSFMEKEHAMTEELASVLAGLHQDVIKQKNGTVDRLLKLIGKHPRNPQLKNLLTSFYISSGEQEKAFAFNRKTIEAHPKYFFGLLNLAYEYSANQEFEKIPELFGHNFDLAELYPERDTFHVSEAMGMAKYAVIYYAHLKEFEAAGEYIDQMKDIDEDDFEVDNAEEILFMAVLEYTGSIQDDDEDDDDDDEFEFDDYSDDFIEVEIAPQKPTTKKNAPVFNHPEIELLYQFDLDYPIEELEQILSLPKVTLIEDLVKVINDGVERYSYFEKKFDQNEITLNETFFVFHAVNLLGELEASDELSEVLDVLRQSEDFLNLYIGIDFTRYVWHPIYKMNKNQFEDFEEFMKEPGVSSDSKSVVSSVILNIAKQSDILREEAIHSYSDILSYYSNADLDDNVIDSMLIAFLIDDIVAIGGKELLPIIERLFDLGYVSEFICGDFEDVEMQLEDSINQSSSTPILPLKEFYQKIIIDLEEEAIEFDEEFGDEDFDYDYEDFDSEIHDNSDFKNSSILNNDQPFIAEKKVGRNDPCPCGSGKKYKKCCL
jgi:tetratricopeptide (TPR) repeat protein